MVEGAFTTSIEKHQREADEPKTILKVPFMRQMPEPSMNKAFLDELRELKETLLHNQRTSQANVRHFLLLSSALWEGKDFFAQC